MIQKFCAITDQEAAEYRNERTIIARLNMWSDQFKGHFAIIIDSFHDPMHRETVWYVAGYDSRKWTGR